MPMRTHRPSKANYLGILNTDVLYVNQEHGELEFRRGDVITVTDKTDQVSTS
jgi:hypothetical protein